MFLRNINPLHIDFNGLKFILEHLSANLLFFRIVQRMNAEKQTFT